MAFFFFFGLKSTHPLFGLKSAGICPSTIKSGFGTV
jgi:hypothetical protein